MSYTVARFDAFRFQAPDDEQLLKDIERMLDPFAHALADTAAAQSQDIEEVNFASIRVGEEPERKMTPTEFNDFLVELRKRVGKS